MSTVDLAFAVPSLLRKQKMIAAGLALSAGGPAANAAVTFAYLGGRATLVTAIGKHPLTSLIRQDLDNFAVTLQDLAPDDRGVPPISAILASIRGGERTVASHFGKRTLRLQRLDQKTLASAELVLVDGHYMKACQKAARLARRLGLTVVLDGGSWKTGMEELLPFVDVAICSEDFRPPGVASRRRILRFLHSAGVKRAALTAGAKSIIYSTADGRGWIAVPPRKSVDTLGAGDIFHGAFCYHYLKNGGRFRDALVEASRVAGRSCESLGTRAWMS